MDRGRQTAVNLPPSAPNRQSLTIDPTSSTKPSLPPAVREYFLPQNYSLPEAFKAAGQIMSGEALIEGVVYRPALVALANVRLLDRKLGVDSEVSRAVLAAEVDKRGAVRWDDALFNSEALKNVESSPVPSARFGAVDLPLNDAKLMAALQKDFTDWVFRTSSVTARTNQTLKVFAGPDISQAEFMKACAEAARAARDAEIAKRTAQIDRQLKTLEDKLAREERELREDESELANRKVEEAGTHLENLTGLFGGRRKASRLSSSLTKRRMTEQAKADVEESIDAIDQFKKQIKDLERQREETLAEINDRWGRAVGDTTEVTVTPKKTDVFVTLFGVGWLPYYMVNTGGETIELPAFGAE